eukprot:jgi/Botrbrau1/20681/Bobra.0058s0011.1
MCLQISALPNRMVASQTSMRFPCQCFTYARTCALNTAQLSGPSLWWSIHKPHCIGHNFWRY